MSSEQAKLLRQQGIAAAKAGQKDQARDLLRQSLRLDPQNEAAWTWLVTVAKDARERAFYLQKLLEINPYSEMGLKALQSMGLTIDQLRALTTQTGQVAGQPVQKVTVQPNVPLPNPQRVANAQEAADEAVARFLTPPTAENIVWTPKKRRRAGERDQLMFRLQVFAGIIGALLVIGAIGVGVLMSTPEGQAILQGASPTYSVTPSLTPSPTFGATPTPSQTPELTSTPSPTPPGELTPADLYRLPPTPTDIYPPIVAEFAIQRAAQAVLEGNTEDALPTLDTARQELVGAIFNPAPVYYQAIALADTGRFDDALEVLEEAETELSNLPADQLRNSLLIHTGFAYVYLKMGEDALARNRSGEASDYFDFVIERAETARDVDPRFVQPYLLLARAYRLQENYTLALNEIRSGLNVPELASDTNLLIEEGEIHLEQGDYDAALYQAYLALYVDPTLQAAHRLQIQAAMLKGDPGLAVIYAQQYIFYYPGSVDAYRLLGDARLAEGNDDLALAAYSQALEGSEDDPAYVETLVSRAALYSQQRRFDLALNDLSSAVALSDSAPSIVLLRMYAAYYAGRYGTASEDADELIGSDVVSDEEIKLMQARIIVDGAAEGDDSQLEAAINLLNEAGDVPSQPGVAAEYRARVQYRLESYEEALRSINAALDAGESGSRYLLLGQILEALEEYDSAARAYEWVLTWSSIYPYPFLPEAQDGLDRVLVAASRSED